jgi:hypothetical protein
MPTHYAHRYRAENNQGLHYSHFPRFPRIPPIDPQGIIFSKQRKSAPNP